jgi:hypothetical protein
LAADAEVVILDTPPAIKDSCKRRVRRPRSPLDVKFLRRSQRISKNLIGFRSQEDVAQAEPVVVEDEHMSANEDEISVPLAIVPAAERSAYEGVSGPSGAATPHLPTDVLQGISIGYLKMWGRVPVSRAALLDFDDE